MGRVTEQDQAAGVPARTVDAGDGIDQQIVERRHPLQQVCRGGKYPSPLPAEAFKVASSAAAQKYLGPAPSGAWP